MDKSCSHLPWIGRLLTAMVIIWAPFAGGTRPAAFGLILVGAVWAWCAWRGKQRGLPLRPALRLLTVLGMLAGPVLLSLPGSYDLHKSLAVAGMIPLFYLAGCAMLLACEEARARKTLTHWISIALVGWVVDGWIQYGWGQDLLGRPVTEIGSLTGPFTSIRFALFLAVLTPMLMQKAGQIRPWLAVVSYLAVLPLVGLSGARATWIMIAVVGLALVWELPWRWRLATLSGIAAIAGMVAVGSPVVNQRLAQTWSLPELSAQHLDYVSSGRWTVWQTAWRMAEAHPWTGVGAGAFRRAYDRFADQPDDPFRRGGEVGEVYHAHQLYVSALAETGWPGLLSLGGIWYLCLGWYLRAPPGQQREARPYAVGLLAALFPLNSQPLLFTIWWFPVLLLLFCLMIAALEPEHVEDHSSLGPHPAGPDRSPSSLPPSG